jgi:hypothetical protein
MFDNVWQCLCGTFKTLLHIKLMCSNAQIDFSENQLYGGFSDICHLASIGFKQLPTSAKLPADFLCHLNGRSHQLVIVLTKSNKQLSSNYTS